MRVFRATALFISSTFILLLVFGCSQTVTGNDVEGAVSACENHGGVYKLEPFPKHNSRVTCRDDSVFYIGRPAN